MLLYGITLVPLVEYLWAADLGLITPFYADNSEFDGSARQSDRSTRILLERGTAQGYFLETSKSIFISEYQAQEAAARQEFKTDGLELKFCDMQ